MIIVYHHSDRVSGVEGLTGHERFLDLPVLKCVLELAKQYPDEILAWCHTNFRGGFNAQAIPKWFCHNGFLFSYDVSGNQILGSAIGYAEENIFIKVNKSVRYPTWKMSSDAGAVHLSIFQNYDGPETDPFDYFLTSYAKRAMPLGLFCYSEPALVDTKKTINKLHQPTKDSIVFKFVKQHYRVRWVFLLLLNLLVYEKRFPFAAFLASLFYKKRSLQNHFRESVHLGSPQISEDWSVDVVIPTIGRKTYLYDFLKDLTQQTILPRNVMIIEQNPQKGSVSELEYLVNEIWPFQIKHTFTHQTGACAARNRALEQTESDWIFFADDDIRITANCIEDILKKMDVYQLSAATVNCQQKGDKKLYENMFQASFFGSGCSIVNKKAAQNSKFSMEYEFGYGEDSDYGMQLRNKGYDVIYLPNPNILHLKAPVGGFRIKPLLPWTGEALQPKPSPTIMLYYLSNYTKEQMSGYKTTLLFKYYRSQSVKNPFVYYRNFKARWDKSVGWANHLKDSV